jgi:spore coat polysaccharide biosynthesis protein SpsF
MWWRPLRRYFMVKSVLIIQARMDSLRLPGKSLLKLDSKPLLEHAVRAAMRVRGIELVIVATSISEADNAIEALCKKLKVECFRGPEQDVLKRIMLAARPHAPDIVIRVCGDEPLLDPEIVEQALAKHIAAGVQYSTTVGRVPKGLDVELISYSTLEKLDKIVKSSKHREHVTSHILEHPKRFSTAELDFGKMIARRDIALTVDTAEDLAFVTEIFHELKGAKRGFASSIVKLVDSGIVSRKPKVLLRADASSEKGMGDVVTLMNIARALAKQFEFVFASKGFEECVQFIKSSGFELMELPIEANKDIELKLIENYCNENHIHHAMIELVPNDVGYITALSRYLKTLTVDFSGGGDAQSDILLNWDIFKTEYKGKGLKLMGPGYAPVALKSAPKTKHSKGILQIVVSMGGSDPYNTSFKIVEALCQDYQVTLILGPGYKHTPPKPHSKLKILNAPANLHSIWAACDLVICGGGFTVFELAALGVPFIGISSIPWESKRLKKLEELGVCRAASIPQIKTFIKDVSDKGSRELMASKGRALVDDKGAKRIAEAVLQRWT